MDKILVGLPRGLYYYYFEYFYKSFFKHLNIDLIISPPTNKEIIEVGSKLASDEMCLSLKIFLGHVSYLKDKCTYLLIPRIDNYGLFNQTCTNFLALYDIVNSIFKMNILDYNIDLRNKDDELCGLISLSKKLGKSKLDIIKAYYKAKEDEKKYLNYIYKINYEHLKSKKIKILLVGHNYNLYDAYVGRPLIKYLNSLNVTTILSSEFNPLETTKLSQEYSPSLYFKYSKESIGSIEIAQSNIKGIIFLSAFPCGLDSLVNELLLRKLKIPMLNLVIDDMDGFEGIKTRLESFVDILEQV